MVDAGKFLVEHRNKNSFGAITYKEGKEVYSKLDKDLEKTIISKVKKIFPKHKIWGEELGKDAGDIGSENFIIIDPIDGTKNYVSGVPIFATQIACIEKGEIVWGIIVLPVLNELFTGVKNVGSFLNGKRIHGSVQKDFSLSNQCFGLGHSAEVFVDLLSKIKNDLAEPRTYGSAGAHFAFTACGRIDIYIGMEAAFYDMAPGIIICKEAGLRICDLQGNEYKHNNGRNTGIAIGNANLIRSYQRILKKSVVKTRK